MIEEKSEPIFEKCVCCDSITKEWVTKNIYERLYYVEGSGQLCPECWIEVYPD